MTFWERKEQGGRKSFRLDELDEKWIFRQKNGILVPYLEALAMDLEERA